MGKRESYEPGTFCWVDLSTSDADGAKDFYSGLFGWEFEDNEIPGGSVYTMCQVRGDTVAAIIQQDQHLGHWNSYVSVASVDETTARAKELGVTVLEEPFDVMEAGRMAVFADPGGATFCAWEAGKHIGAGRVNDIGCLGWNELQTPNPDTASDLYSRLFDWSVERMEHDGTTVYVLVKNSAGRTNGGIMPIVEGQDDTLSHWLPYFVVTSCDEAVAHIEELGGELLAGPMEPGAGKIAVTRDPQGAVFAVFEGQTDD